jgi:UDP-galactopyranose mutase
MKKYDYVIVGSGLFGATFAHKMTEAGRSCLVLEKSNHIGGNCYTENRDGINVHMYGPHIFHTNDKDLWQWVNQFAEFKQYKQSTKAYVGNTPYSLPINLATLQQIWPWVTTPEAAKKQLKIEAMNIPNPTNLEEWILSQVGRTLYQMFIAGYTEKQWGKHPSMLPASIIKRLPIRTSFDDNYYFDKYQGIPIGGYTQIFEQLLRGSDVILGCDFFDKPRYNRSLGTKLVYTGMIDEFFGYEYGELEYRTLDFQHKVLQMEDFQGCSIINTPDKGIPTTRITEHKHFEGSKSPVTWISLEFPRQYKRGDTPYYPINDEANSKRYTEYKRLAELQQPDVIFGGRLAEYRYYDMHQVIASALTKAKQELQQ